MKRGVKVLTVSAAVLFAWVAAGGTLGRRLMRQADESWSQGFESMDAFAGRHPARATSTGAAELDDLAGALGLSLRGQPRAVDTDAVRRAGDAVASFAELAGAPSDAERPVPSEVAVFLATHEKDLAAIEAKLLGGDEIVWEEDVTRGVAAPLPSFSGLRGVNALLLARALAADDRNDRTRVARSLEAAWRLRATLGGRPELISRLAIIALARSQYGVLRHLRSAPEVWQGRLVGEDFRPALQEAFQTEAWLLSRLGRDADSARVVVDARWSPTVWRWGGWPFAAPLIRASAANVSARLHAAAFELKNGGQTACSAEPLSRAIEDWVPRWNLPGRIAVPGLLRSWRAAVEASLEAEMTRLVLRAKAPRPSSIAEALPDVVGSEICHGVQWAIDEQADGSVNVRADPRPFGGKGGAALEFAIAARR